MARRDPSQIPIERLAQLLLECARADAALPRRTPANDDPEHALYVATTYNQIEALPALRPEPEALSEFLRGSEALPELRRESQAMSPDPHLTLPLTTASQVASNEELEDLVAVALASAHEAEDVSWQASETSRKARHGMMIAVGLAVLGIAIAGTAAVSARLYGGDDQQMAQLASQVQALDKLQQHIDQQLAEIHAQEAVQEASAEQAAPPAQASDQHADQLPPLPSRVVRVLPAEPAVAQAEPAVAPAGAAMAQAEPALAHAGPAVGPAGPTVAQAEPSVAQAEPSVGQSGPAVTQAERPMTDQQDRSGRRAESEATPAAYAVYSARPTRSYAPRAEYRRPWKPYRSVRHYRTRIVLPRPVVYLFSSVQRSVQTLFH